MLRVRELEGQLTEARQRSQDEMSIRNAREAHFRDSFLQGLGDDMSPRDLLMRSMLDNAISQNRAAPMMPPPLYNHPFNMQGGPWGGDMMFPRPAAQASHHQAAMPWRSVEEPSNVSNAFPPGSKSSEQQEKRESECTEELPNKKQKQNE